LKRNTTTAILIVTLLAQAAVAFGRAPCTMPAADPGAAVAEHQHGGSHPDGAPAPDRHAHHLMIADVGAEQAPPAPHGDCCADMTTMDCATTGCATGFSTMLLLPLPAVAAPAIRSGGYREPDWLPPYLTPSTTIYRPPIA